MPPRSQYTKRMLPHPEECRRTLDDWRRIAAINVAKSNATVDVPHAAAAASSSSVIGNVLQCQLPPNSGVKRDASRKDLPVIKNARRGGFAQAIEASRNQGLQPLIDDLHKDREASSGVGSTLSHVATWTKFHCVVYGPVGGDNWVPVLPLIPDQVVAVAALFKAGDYRSFANYWSSLKSRHVDHWYAWTENLTHVPMYSACEK